ncbi:MAG: DotI/IcmL/TraM family protein [Coxiellaceae bacterium]|nr:DotI/IcmL/TraM family protein [Coxiellaceae bacterium]
MAQNNDFQNKLNNFYRVQYAWLLRVLNVLIIAIVVLFVVIMYQDYKKPWPSYYQSGADGSISRIYGITSPVVGPRALRDWATQVAVSAYTYNFNDYQQRFEETREYFTSAGWSAFASSINNSNLIDKVTTQKMIVSSVASGATVIVDQQVVNDTWTWKVQVPLLVSYRGGVVPSQDNLVVTMLITRVPSSVAPKGIAVAQFYSVPRGGGTELT